MTRPAKSVVLIGISILVALSIRTLLGIIYRPLYGYDSPGYEQLGRMIQTRDFTGYNAFRTPGYAIMVMLCRYDWEKTKAAQHVLGFGTFLLVLALMKCSIEKNLVWPFSLFFAISIQFPFYEALIQTESSAGFAVAASVALFLWHHHKGSKLALCASGLMASGGALIRPHLVILPGALFLAYLLTAPVRRYEKIRNTIILLIPAIVLIGGWMVFNRKVTGEFTFSTLPKVALISHMIPYAESADDRFGVFRDAYVEAYHECRDQTLAAGDNRAIYTTVALQKLLARGVSDPTFIMNQSFLMALNLIQKHPFKYLMSVVSAWLRFWRVHIIVYGELFPPETRWYLFFTRLWIPIKVAWLAANTIVIAALFLRPWRYVSGYGQQLLVVNYIVLGAASLSQAFTLYFDNARFAVPFQPLVLINLAILANVVFKAKQRNACQSEQNRVPCVSNPQDTPQP